MKTKQNREDTYEISETFQTLFSFEIERRLKIIDNNADSCKVLKLDELGTIPVKLDDLKVEVQDKLDEVNLGNDVIGHRPIFISSVLSNEIKIKLVSLLIEPKTIDKLTYYFSKNLP